MILPQNEVEECSLYGNIYVVKRGIMTGEWVELNLRWNV